MRVKNLVSNVWRLVRPLIVGAASVLIIACASQSDSHKWTHYVSVEGQPEAVPAEWVATPEGRFAHSLKVPNPLPSESGYRFGMTSEQYFDHLCKAEAGEFIFRTIANVEGLFFMRPPRWPTDDDLRDRYKLEAPGIERTFQLLRDTSVERGTLFVDPPWAGFAFIEEPNSSGKFGKPYVRVYGYRQNVSPMAVEPVDTLRSRYGLIWRGIKRSYDRELNISGGEWIVLDLKNNEVLAVQRNFARTGFTRNSPAGIWWLNASSCSNVPTKSILGKQIYEFVRKSLIPAPGSS